MDDRTCAHDSRVEKFQAHSEIRDLVAEQKKLKDFERSQKEIDGFLVCCFFFIINRCFTSSL